MGACGHESRRALAAAGTDRGGARPTGPGLRPVDGGLRQSREGPGERARPPLGPAGTLTLLALVGLILAGVLGTYAFLGGWLTPGALTPARITDAFEHVAGVHPGFRRNHAKGVAGFFESNEAGARFSRAMVFRRGRVPVLGRFSLSGGRPDVADAPGEVRGLGLQFSLPDGERWRTAMINLPVFPFRTPEAFYENLVASAPDPKTGKPDPAGMKAFLDRHPETMRALALIKGRPIASGFDNTTFHSLNAFRFTNPAGVSVLVRWLLEPAQPFEAASAAPWGMRSAARYPVVLYGSVHLPFIVPPSATLYAVLRKAHTVLAYLFFLTFLAHFAAILFHTLVLRDGILKRMAPRRVR